MRTTCGHDRPNWYYLGVPFIIRGWIWANIVTNVGTIVTVGTISVYLSLSEGGFWINIGTNAGTIVEVGTISAYLSLSDGGFGPTLSKVNIIAAQITPSGH